MLLLESVILIRPFSSRGGIKHPSGRIPGRSGVEGIRDHTRPSDTSYIVHPSRYMQLFSKLWQPHTIILLLYKLYWMPFHLVEGCVSLVSQAISDILTVTRYISGAVQPLTNPKTPAKHQTLAEMAIKGP